MKKGNIAGFGKVTGILLLSAIGVLALYAGYTTLTGPQESFWPLVSFIMAYNIIAYWAFDKFGVGKVKSQPKQNQ